MSKRLILVLALAFVVGLTFTAYAEVQNVKVSGDITVLGVARQLELNNSKAAGTGTTGTYPDTFLASIARVRVDADLTDNVSTTVRILNERYWGSETENTGSVAASSDRNVNTDIDLDLAYVTLKEFLYSPLTMTVGRQELHFGNEMIVGDPDTNNAVSSASPFSNVVGTTSANRLNADLSARKSFDAIRATLNYDPLVIDIIGAKIAEAVTNSYDDTNLYGVNAGYDLTKNTKVEAYWFERNVDRKANTNINKPTRTDVIGARVSTTPIENLMYQLEVAYQFGRYNTNTAAQPTVALKAWALETSLTYDFKKVKYTPSLTALYAYFSGDSDNYDTNAGHRRGWDPMYENQTFGNIHNVLWNQTNQHIAGIKGSMKPMEDITLKGEYYGYWLAKRSTNGLVATSVARPGQNLVFTKKGGLGQELDVTATYDYTEDVQFSLLTGVYWAGNALSNRNDNTATEVIGSMKVTF
ncbi:MAG: alginate export family protein [Candidatus Omnitrophota bacterium]